VTQRKDEQVLEQLLRRFPGATLLASGMEGRVYRIAPGLVAKAWFRRTARDLLPLQLFYADLRAVGVPLETPEILEIAQAHSWALTIERELPGTPLAPPEDATSVSVTVKHCLLQTLEAIRQVPARDAQRQLAVLDEPRPLWSDANGWTDALTGLMDRRLLLFGAQLRRAVRGFDAKIERIRKQLEGLSGRPLTLIHGDLIPVNLMVDRTLRPIGVLDFGFMSTAGDPAFDATVAASTFNMYGRHARANDDELTRFFAVALGYDLETMLLYKMVYAAITSNAYDSLGADGHFAWCARVLDRDDVEDLLDWRQ
jgi:Ser/Thr protein kinase RdoA (MazF antagonist)